MYSAKASFLSKRNTCIFMLATDSLQYPLCSDTLLSTSCREEFIMKKSFVQSPFCVPTAPRYLLTQQEGPSHAERAESPQPCSVLLAGKQAAETSQTCSLQHHSLQNICLSFQEGISRALHTAVNVGFTTHTTRALAAHTEQFPSLPLLPCCTFARVLTAP